ncbi:hypothetical protein [Stenotrophomonas sp. GZD-301]|uniref:hypothetical protein n=1 Tax=Stenotrophomonas sp. GZD-301 TaxID=3404814 RepID=UPI003BB4A92B
MGKNLLTIIVVSALAASPGWIGEAAAATPKASPTATQWSAPVELSMRINGEVDIAVDGRITALRIDNEKGLSPTVLGMVRTTVETWQFEPINVDGSPVAERAAMTLRLVAVPGEDGQYAARVRSANFRPLGTSETRTRSRNTRLPPPEYPKEPGARGNEATVYLALLLEPDGKVRDAMVEQVNLRQVGSEQAMREVREKFARAALSATRRWKIPPNEEELRTKASQRIVRIPVGFSIMGSPTDDLGKWMAYSPGPTTSIPWYRTASTVDSAPDLLPEGSISVADAADTPRLRTPLES